MASVALNDMMFAVLGV